MTAEPTVKQSEPSSGRKETRLSGRMGMASLVLSVLAFSAPIVSVSGYIPFTIIFAGQAAPVAFAVATVLLMIFAVGYIAMTRTLPTPGAFYAYITSGLGKAAGLGAAFLAVIAYLALLAGVYVFAGITATSLIASFGGPETPWWLWSLVSWAVVGVLGYFHVELSAKVLSLVMVLEVALVMIFNVATLARGGAEGLSLAPFSPAEFAKGDMPITMVFVVMVFIGFEATALYRDEVKAPDTTVPRSTYLAVIFIGVLYTLSCYALVSAYGSAAVDTATNEPATMFGNAIGHFVGPAFSQIAFVLIATSAIAALLSIHNVIARYVHNLGTDRALPSYLARVHPRHKSPHTASTTVSAVVAIGLIPFLLAGTDPSVLYGQFGGLGSTGILALMALVSLAVIAWFRRRRELRSKFTVWNVVVAPFIAFAAFSIIIVLVILHFELVVGGDAGQSLGLLLVLAGALVAGMAAAIYFRIARPEIYARLGTARGQTDEEFQDEIATSSAGQR
ncbi:APC family permease [Arthrobacter sp. I2-34]|uniref:APC family permease n=1 Tax=Arthrobacter hankyongi TaxID=2904801 RepID=A0ABS9L5B0_9MICC|nr:APC family permease [Arthrobacter hankyongi]MCG2621859.1 APC family permease [Arthrobacter hankyongi]